MEKRISLWFTPICYSINFIKIAFLLSGLNYRYINNKTKQY